MTDVDRSLSLTINIIEMYNFLSVTKVYHYLSMIECYKHLSLKWYKWYRPSDWMIIITICSFIVVIRMIIIDNGMLSDRPSGRIIHYLS